MRWVSATEQLTASGRILRRALAPVAAQRQLSESQLWLLLACCRAPTEGLGQSQLASRLAASPAQISAQVERLRAGGLVEARRDQSDRRRQFWRPTPAGEAAIRQVLMSIADWAADMDRQLGTKRLAALSRLLGELLESLSHPPGTALPTASTLRMFAPEPESGDPRPVRKNGPRGQGGENRRRRATS